MWTELLDKRHEPGRYVLIRSDGLVVYANENGTIDRQKSVENPSETVTMLSRVPGIRVVPPAKQKDIIKKINFYLERL
ncbi:hypothetical protein [Spirosoma validum]|uniref:Uncharacterized protein n=1 Tax=Spirosoma validum TaxID=2771355 RepID=A0A927B1N3_9BACT|nr:hypothetical protein [Spirosoma validum]MBD2753721.1 hypothetical protein [Spirosoma validum]